MPHLKFKSVKQCGAIVERRNKSLDSVILKKPKFSCQGKVGDFISIYLCCELFATKIQNFYQHDNNLKKTNLNISSLGKSLQYYDLHFCELELSSIYRGGKGKRNHKSARQLRNGYLHQLSESDKNEIIEKYDELIYRMEKFLDLRLNTHNKKIHLTI